MGHLPVGPGACENNKFPESDKVKAGPLLRRDEIAGMARFQRQYRYGGNRGNPESPVLYSPEPGITADLRRKYGRHHTRALDRTTILTFNPWRRQSGDPCAQDLADGGSRLRPARDGVLFHGAVDYGESYGMAVEAYIRGLSALQMSAR